MFYLILYKSVANLQVDAAKGRLGMLWWVLEPILYMAAFYIVFTVIRARGDNIVSFLLVGLVPWKWFATTIVQGSYSIVGGAALIQQVYVPKYFFPAVVLLTNTFKFMIIFFLLLLFLAVSGETLSWALLWVPFLILVQLIVVAAMSFFLAAILPFAIDIKTLIENVMMLLFFLSGVIFDISRAPDWIQPYLYLNPMVSIVEGYRDVLLNDVTPKWGVLGLVAFVSLLLLLVAHYLLARYDRIYPKILMR